ncbi:MAG: type IV secretion system DNA-binding domain-containing protein [Verrucomicrobiota bacterium]
MSQIDEQLTEQFYRWEMRGRGGLLFDAPVSPEPPFVPFTGHLLPRQNAVDDGRRETVGSRFLSFFGNRVEEPPVEDQPDIEQEPEPRFCQPEELIELQLTLPESRSPSPEFVEALLHQVCRKGQSLCFEILGTAREIIPQFVVPPRAATRIERALKASLPDLVTTQSAHALHQAWLESEDCFGVVELGLGIEFMVPLAVPRADLLTNVVTALEGLAEGELGLCQILFEPAQNNWSESMVATVTDADGNPFFVNRPELVSATIQKTASPLFGVVVRLAASAAETERAWEIIADMAAGFSALSRARSNYLVPLPNDSYAPFDHEDDILSRLSRRSGMLLNLDELTRFLILPTAAASRRLRRNTIKTQAAPAIARHGGSLVLGDNLHAGVMSEVCLAPEQRVRHMHCIGASGTGKSTLLFNLIRQDIENGQGVALLDPHGDLADKVLGIIPAERIKDVVLIDPSDEEYSVGFNILAAHSDFEKNLLASDLVSVFQRLSTSWGDQMNSVLRNAILAFLESTEGGTLADLRRFLLDAVYRNRFLGTVTDPEILYYWRKAFPQLSGNKSIGPIITRLDEFLSRKPIRYMVSQKENRVNFAEVFDKGRILIAKLPQGLIGRENSYLLGSLLLSKLQQMAMSRQRMPEAARRDFWCYVDEFHCFMTPSLAEILSGARKYRVGLVLAHQELRQIQADSEVASAVLSNAFTRVVFRVGDADARSLESGFSHFEARDLQNLDIGQAICRIERSDGDFNLAVKTPEPSCPDEEECRREEIILASRAQFARPRSEIEAELFRKLQMDEEEQPVQRPAPVATPIETAKPAEPAPIAETPKVSEFEKPLPEFGRGGGEHREIQQNIKALGEELGFRAVIEKSVLDGAGHVDVSLEREDQKIACEVSVTTNAEHEVANVQKCLDAGYGTVILIVPQKDRLLGLVKTLESCLPEESMQRVHVCPPNRVGSLLKKLIRRFKRSGPSASQYAGYKVTRKYAEEPDNDARAVENDFLHLIARALRGDDNQP